MRLGLAARGHGKLKVRQPLRAAVVVAAGEEREAIERMQDVVLEELNVKELRFVSEADELGSYEVKPELPRARPALRQADAAGRGGGRGARPRARRRRRCATAAASGISVNGHDHELGGDDLTLAMQPLEGYQLEREGSHAVALELELDDELRREGLAREIVHAVQNARKAAGLQVEDRIALGLGGDEELLAAGAGARGLHRAGDARAARRLRRARTARRRRPSRAAPFALIFAVARWPRPARGSISASRRFFGIAPWMRLATWPSRKSSSVGIAMIWYSDAVWMFSSVLSFTTFSSGRSPAISSTIGATMRHGPHHGAQKSTSTGWSDSMTSAWKLVSVTSVTPAMSLLVAGLLQKV